MNEASPPAVNSSPAPFPSPPSSLSFEQFAQGKQEILIEFKGQIYRLRATKNDKLILNK